MFLLPAWFMMLETVITLSILFRSYRSHPKLIGGRIAGILMFPVFCQLLVYIFVSYISIEDARAVSRYVASITDIVISTIFFLLILNNGAKENG